LLEHAIAAQTDIDEVVRAASANIVAQLGDTEYVGFIVDAIQKYHDEKQLGAMGQGLAALAGKLDDAGVRASLAAGVQSVARSMHGSRP
jgi:hypothetical protein